MISFDIKTILAYNEINGSPIFKNFQSGNIQIKIKPKALNLDSSRILEFENNLIYYKDSNNSFALTRLDESQFDFDGTQVTITDDDIPTGTEFLGNFPNVVITINGVQTPVVFTRIKQASYERGGWYILEGEQLGSVSRFTTEITGFPGTSLKENTLSMLATAGDIIPEYTLVYVDMLYPDYDETFQPFAPDYIDNIVSKYITIDFEGNVGKYYRDAHLGFYWTDGDYYDIGVVDFRGTTIEISNPGETGDFIGYLDLSAKEKGTIKNFNLMVKDNIQVKTLISNIGYYYGSSNDTMYFENCSFYFEGMDYDYFGASDGSNIEFVNCKITIPTNNLEMYNNKGEVHLTDCEVTYLDTDTTETVSI